MVLPDVTPIPLTEKISPTIARVAGLIISPLRDFYVLNRLPHDHPWAPGKLDLMTMEDPDGIGFHTVMGRYIESLGLDIPFDQEMVGQDHTLKFHADRGEYRLTHRVFFSSNIFDQENLRKLNGLGYETFSIEQLKEMPITHLRSPILLEAIIHHAINDGVRLLEHRAPSMNTFSLNWDNPSEVQYMQQFLASLQLAHI